MTRPGSRLRSLAQRVCDRSTMERLIEPVIADLQCEHSEAIRRGQAWRSRWVRLAGYLAFLKVTAIATCSASTRAARGWAMADDKAVGRTILFSLAATAVMVALMVWVPLSHAPYATSGKVARLILFLLPQAVPVGLPTGLVVGVLCGLRGRVTTRRTRRAIAALAVVCSLATLVDVAWALPASNQAFRELMSGGPVARGMNELTLGELAARDASRLRFVSPDRTNRLAFEFNFRLALAFAPLALGLFSLGVMTARRGAYGWFAIGLIASATCFAYYVLLFSARAGLREWLPAVVAGWTPNLVFLAIAFLLLRVPGPSASGTPCSGLDVHGPAPGGPFA